MTYSTEITESKVNMFSSMDPIRFKGYKKFGYFKTIQGIMSLATNSSEELKTQVDVLKKWSVLRQLHKNGYDVSRILKHPKFSSLSADTCANLIRSNIDKICNKVITGLDEAIDFDAKWIVDNIYSKTCTHCGESDWHKLGCNRLDNTKPHTKDNVEPCCQHCNCVLG